MFSSTTLVGLWHVYKHTSVVVYIQISSSGTKVIYRFISYWRC